VRRWSVEEGLAEGAVTSVDQDANGFIWVTTLHHVMRFDGLRFVAVDEGAPWVGSSGVLLGGFRDKAGVFAVYGSAGAFRFDGKSWQPMPFRDDRHAAVFQMFETEDGALWAATGAGVARWDGAFLNPVAPPDSAKYPLIQTASFAGPSACWMTDSMRLLTFAGGKYAVVPKPKGCSNISSLHAGRSGRIFLTAGARVFFGQPGRWENTPSMPLEPFGPILETSAGEIWVGSQYGLQRFRNGGWTTLDVRNAAGSGALDVHGLAEGRHGELWAGTSDGLIRLEPVRVKNYYSALGGRDKDLFQAVLADSPQHLWAGIAVEGLLEGNPSDLRPVYGGIPPALTVSALCKSQDGSLWIGTQGNYLWWLGGGKVRNITKSPAGVAARGINAIQETSEGQILLGTWEGLMEVDGAQIAPVPVVGLNANTRSHLLDSVHCLLEDNAGSVWVGYQTQGLLMQTQDGRQFRYGRADGLPSNCIHALYQDSEGVLWIGTPAGLGRWQGKSHAVIAAAQGLEDEDIHQIVDDQLGNLWVAAHSGIFRISKNAAAEIVSRHKGEIIARRFGQESGMVDEETTSGFGSLCTRTADGKLWFCTRGGLVMIEPGALEAEKPRRLQVFLEEFRVNGETIWTSGVLPTPDAGPGLKSGSAPLEPFVLPPGARDAQFHFTAPSFAAPERLRFRWRLEGLDHGWSLPGTVRHADYASLAAGHYQFRVAAADASGVWREAATLSLEVRPHYWQAWWFRTLVLLLLGGCVGVGARIYERGKTRRQMERLEREQAVERERMRIARDIHDDLGARLTQIMLLSQPSGAQSDSAFRASEEIYQTARSLVRDVTEIVWAVNPEHDTLDSLAAYFGEFAQSFLGPAGIRCRLDFPLNLLALALGSHVRHNLFLAYKEALNNVVRHAGASKVEISLALQPGGFVLSIRDDGHGCSPSVPEQRRVIGGNGLLNMRHRLGEIGGTCEICPAPDGGTLVRFTAPMG